MSDEYRMVMLDFPGHGFSSGLPECGYTIKTFSSILNALIKTEGLRKPVLVGWSLGGASVCYRSQEGTISSHLS